MHGSRRSDTSTPNTPGCTIRSLRGFCTRHWTTKVGGLENERAAIEDSVDRTDDARASAEQRNSEDRERSRRGVGYRPRYRRLEFMGAEGRLLQVLRSPNGAGGAYRRAAGSWPRPALRFDLDGPHPGPTSIARDQSGSANSDAPSSDASRRISIRTIPLDHFENGSYCVCWPRTERTSKPGSEAT